jgi:hypothetical protein
MTTYPNSMRRLILAGGFALAVAAVPAITLATQPAHVTPLATCTSGEEEDVFTTTCTPMLVPNSPEGAFTSTAANPDIPEINGVPCTGGDSGACIGMAENAIDAGPQPVPRSTISSSP